MPSRVLRSSWFAMENEYSTNMRSSITSSYEENNSVQTATNLHSTNRQHRRSLHSPPPLIPNSGYFHQKVPPKPTEANKDGSAFMMQFMTAAAAAAMAAASKKCDVQDRQPDPYASSRISGNEGNTNRRPSSNFSLGQNVSPSSTSSSCRSLSGQDGGCSFSGIRSDAQRIVGDIQNALPTTSEKVNEDDEINIVHDEMNKNSGRRSGCSLPLPPGAVPVGTFPRPTYRHSAIQPMHGLFTQLKSIPFIEIDF